MSTPKKKSYLREKKICKSIELAYDSLKSHLESTYDPLPKSAPEKYKQQIGGQKFHKQCVREYAEIINTLANEL